MSGAQQAIVFISFLGVLVTVHELGHFLAAKWAGVKVVKFSETHSALKLVIPKDRR